MRLHRELIRGMSCFLILGSFKPGRTMVTLLVYMDDMGYLRAGDFLTFCRIKQAESSSLSPKIVYEYTPLLSREAARRRTIST